MTTRPLSVEMRRALTAMLKAPLRRAKHVSMGDGWLDQGGDYFALSTVRNLHERGLVQKPMRLAVLTIAGRQMAQRIHSENTTRPAEPQQGERPCSY